MNERREKEERKDTRRDIQVDRQPDRQTDRITLLILLFLISLISTGGACPITSLADCDINSLLDNLTLSHASYSEQDLNAICRQYDEVQSCVTRSNCSGLPAQFTELWTGFNDAFRYLCVDAKREYLNHIECLSKHSLERSLSICTQPPPTKQETSVLSSEGADPPRTEGGAANPPSSVAGGPDPPPLAAQQQTADETSISCVKTNQIIACYWNTTRLACGRDAGRLMSSVVTRLFQPSQNTLNCHLRDYASEFDSLPVEVTPSSANQRRANCGQNLLVFLTALIILIKYC